MSKLTISFLLLVALPLLGQGQARDTQPTKFQNIHIVKKDRAGAGDAVITVKNKTWRIARNAYQVFPVMGGENGLILIRDPKLPAGQSQLFYVEGESRKRRELGVTPFKEATLTEAHLGDGWTVFVLHGKNESKSSIIVADLHTIHAVLTDATDPQVTEQSLRYRLLGDNQTQNTPLVSLVGDDLKGIYQYTGSSSDAVQYAQFQPDGTAYIVDREGHTHKGIWRTNGYRMTVQERADKNAITNHYDMSRAALVHIDGIPAATRLTVRLSHPLSSVKMKVGEPVEGVLISAAYLDGKIYLPQGTQFFGSITKGHGVGWAVPHETAVLSVEFTSVKLEDGTTLPVRTHLYQVENARETVNAKGAIEGVRSTGTLGHSAESKVASIAAFEPMAYLFTTVSATSLLGFAEPEILYNAGTEVLVEFDAPLITSKTYPPTSPALANSPEEHEKLTEFVHQLPFRTVTKGSNKPSDVTNLVFLGRPDALQRAFKAAGWVKTDELTANSTFMTMKSIGGNQVYQEAPMSVLLLDERPPIFTLSKTTNTFNSRHHIRVFDPVRRFDGTTVLTASSTQDIGIGFSSKQKTFIHIIDQYIDNERSKVVQDLQFTGCVESAEYVDRPWVPKDAYNSTGDKLRTDGAAVVLKMTACEHPRSTSNKNAVPPARFQRIIRDTVLTLRNDIVRGNVAYQGVSGTLWARNYFAHRNDLKPDSGAWLKTDVSGENFKGFGTASDSQQPATRSLATRDQDQLPSHSTPDPEVIRARESHRWDPPRYEIGLQGGYLRYPSLRTEGVLLLLTSKDPTFPDFFAAVADQVNGGWTAGIYVIANTWKRFSNEFSYNYQRGKYETINLSAVGDGTDVDLDSNTVGLVTRQFEYNLLFHLRPPRSRWRPYLAAGPALQLISLDGAVIKKPAGPFRLGLQNIGVLKAAFDFGGTPPLEGGGIYQLGLQYGAGIKYRVLPRLTINTDYRETWSKNPDFIRDSYTGEYFADEFYDLNVTKIGSESKFRQQRFTFGFAFTF